MSRYLAITVLALVAAFITTVELALTAEGLGSTQAVFTVLP